MDFIESIKKNKAYAKYKQIVKIWEKDFKSNFSRIPSKFDIKEAPAKIKYAYKKYFQLKTMALENSLSICEAEDEFCRSPEYSVSYESPQKDQYPDNDHCLPTLPTSQELEKLLSDVSTSSIHDHKSPDGPKSANLFTDKLSRKLFQDRKFSLRNPRKVSLSKSQLIECESENIMQSSDKKDNSYINIRKTMIDEKLPDLSNLTENSTPTCTSHQRELVHRSDNLSLRKLSTAWLDRASGVTIEQPPVIQENGNKFGISNIQVSVSKEKTYDIVENSESENDDIKIGKLKPAVKKLKMTDTKFLCLKKQHLDVSNNKLQNKLKKGRKQKLGKGLKNYEEMIPKIDEYLPFGLEEGILPRYPKPDDILKSVPPFMKPYATETNEELEKIERKISSGTLNDNFVKINIERKVFVRGRKNKYSTYKKQQYKDKKALHAGMEFPECGKISCFKCDQSGHLAQYCTAHRGESLLSLNSYNEDKILSLDDMQNIVSKETNNASLASERFKLSAYEPSPVPESFKKLLLVTPTSVQETNIKPIYSHVKVDAPPELYEALQKFGHKSFKSGQKEVIMRVLCGMSSILILPTGGGKSLCYQLPAYIYSQHYKCITLVISPLVSLMEDQALSMPEFLKAGCLHTNQSSSQRQKMIQSLKDGEIKILLISPEALISGDGSSGFTGLFKSLPPIAFACIDEAHCVSQWSHNFRPSYLMICNILHKKLNVKCILGLTATASQTTIKSIIRHINIPDGVDGVITNPSLPDNLFLSVSYVTNKDQALVQYLTSERIISFKSIIVYCIRRDECERVAAVLRSCLQEPGKISMEQSNKKRKRMSYIAESYHAGMSAAQRKKIQKNFMDGTLRIIVATVAFGMGINKSDIRCIIHYNTPSSFESYVQEIGRAGRDGKQAYCHVFMNNDNGDNNELLRYIHSNSIDRPIIRKLLQKIFISCQCKEYEMISSCTSTNHFRCKGHEVGIPIDRTVEELDLPSENIATLLCYLELHPKHYIKVMNKAYTVCKISSYGGSQKLLEAAKNCPPLAMAYLLESKKDPSVIKQNFIEFNVIEVAAAIGWDSGMTKYVLKNLEWTTDNERSKRSLLTVEFSSIGFRIKSPGDLTAFELDSILDDLYDSVRLQEKTMLCQLEESNKAFAQICFSPKDPNQLPDNILMQKSNELKQIIRKYFKRDNTFSDETTFEKRPLDVERVSSDVRAMISSYKDCTFTGRSIARIFQGISSPNYPAIVWGRCKYWRSHIHEDFYGIIKIATQQIIKMKPV